MDVYVFGLALGSAGLGVMAVSGLAHTHGGHAHGHGHSHGHAGHSGHSHGLDVHAGHHGAHAHHGGAHAHETSHDLSHGAGAAHAHAAQQAHDAHHPALGSRVMWSLLSPRVVFSALVGFGATGLLLKPLLDGAVLFGAAVVGGVAFERLIVEPLWRFLFRFASAPALTLESCVEDEARAVTTFDSDGHGLIAVELDGQIVQLLGVLTPSERAARRSVHAGDRLRIEAVDSARNRCTVSYLGV